MPVFEIKGKQDRMVQMANDLEFYDRIQTSINTNQNFELMMYMNYPVCGFHRLFACTNNVKLEFPKICYQVEQIKKQISGLERGFMNGINENHLWMNQPKNIMELTPYLLFIISPKFLPVNMQFIKPNERVVLNRLVELFVKFGLKLVKDSEGKYLLEPPIDILVDLSPFAGERKTVKDLAYGVIQLIEQEVFVSNRLRLGNRL
jgi:chromosome transmission fidelity protein 18